MSEFKRIPPEQAQALREQGAVVVDVRDPATFAALHISGSKHLDNHSLHAFIQGADLDAPTVVVCYHGNSSQGAAAYLEPGLLRRLQHGRRLRTVAYDFSFGNRARHLRIIFL